MPKGSAARNGADVAMRLKGCAIVLLVLFIALVGVIVVPPLLVPRQYTELLDAARDGDIQAIDRLLDAGIDVNAAYYEGLGRQFSKRGTRNTALVIAARCGKLAAVDHLLDRGASPWLWNSSNSGPFGHLQVQTLATCRCTLHGVERIRNDGEGGTERKDFKRCAEARRVLAKLTLKGLEEYSKNKLRPVLYLREPAVYSGDAEVVRKVYLARPDEPFEEGPYAHATDPFEAGLFAHAAEQGDNAVVLEMVQHVSDVAALGRAAASAIEYGHADVALLLLDRGGVPSDIQDREGWTLLHLAASQDDAVLVRQLLERGARTDIRDKTDKLPIDYANDKTVRRLLAQTP